MARVYLEGEYEYGSGETAGGAIVFVFLAFGLALCVRLPGVDGAWKLLPIGLSAMTLVVAAVWVFKGWRGDRDHFRITDDGVDVNDEHWPWDEIRWLYANGNPGLPTIELKLATRRVFFCIDLPVRPKLSPAAYEQLIEQLKITVAPRFPDVQFGGYLSGS